MVKAVFKEIIPNSYPVLRYVYPIMQRHVKQLIDQAIHISAIEGIILFGSSVELTCGQDSDLDIVMIFNKDRSQDEIDEAIRGCRKGIPVPIDVLVNNWDNLKIDAEHNAVYREVLEKGLVIYRRDVK